MLRSKYTMIRDTPSTYPSPLRGFVRMTYSCRHYNTESRILKIFLENKVMYMCTESCFFTGLEIENELDSVKVMCLISSRCIVWIR